MAVIQVLDKHVAELIAAGEVVERPASVIKELVENTLDAGARHVTVEIRDGGVTYMRVTDDGCGMTREDVPTAFLRHATSKVRTATDLNGIGTLGFRGEALASVAAVARVDLTTCAKGEIVGTHYVIHGGTEMLIEDAGCPEGTTFVVQDLFYNVPARMKFLKKDVSEGNAVAGVMERLALSHPEVGIRFIREGRTELQTSGSGDLKTCIYEVFGKAFSAGLIPVDYEAGGVRVSGYICKPEACRQNRTMQHFFVNGRYVKTQTGMVALERAYKGVMMVGKFPTCVLSLEMPPETVDANVHPAKIEVRFINEKPVFDAVYYAVRSAIETGDTFRRVLLGDEQRASSRQDPPTKSTVTPPTFKPATPVKTESIAPAFKPISAPVRPTVKAESRPAPSFLDLVVDDDRPLEAAVADGTLKPYIPTAKEAPAVSKAAVKPIEKEPDKPAPAVAPEQMVMEKPTPVVNVLGEVFSTYIVAEMGDSIFLIDKHAAHERILYNELKKNARADEQMLLVPVSVTVSREEHTALIENTDALAQAGILLEDFGGGTVLIRSFPMMLSGEDIEGTIREVATGLAAGGHEVLSAKLDWIYHSTACRAATKGGDVGRMPALIDLAKQVLLQDDIRYCPHGRPVCVEMTRKELEKQFGRIQ